MYILWAWTVINIILLQYCESNNYYSFVKKKLFKLNTRDITERENKNRNTSDCFRFIFVETFNSSLFDFFSIWLGPMTIFAESDISHLGLNFLSWWLPFVQNPKHKSVPNSKRVRVFDHTHTEWRLPTPPMYYTTVALSLKSLRGGINKTETLTWELYPWMQDNTRVSLMLLYFNKLWIVLSNNYYISVIVRIRWPGKAYNKYGFILFASDFDR